MADDNDNMPAVSRMLVVGDDTSSRHAVLEKLRVLCGQKPEAVSQPLALSTKYYSAQIDVHDHDVHENEPLEPLAHALEDFEAVVCVVDTAREESFLHVSRFLTQLASEPIDVRLVVGQTLLETEKTAKVAHHIERIQTWCLDNEFEFIELLDESSNDNNNNKGNAGDANEKRGIDRVLEALHCTMWASMVMRSAQSDASDSGLQELANVSVALAPSSDAETTAKATTSSVSNQQLDQTEDAATAATDDGDDDDARLRTLLRALEITEATDSASASSASDVAAKTPTTSNNQLGADDDDDDLNMAEFSALISEVRRARDGGQMLSDEQRRERAAEVAMKLWSFLGADDESDDE